MNSVRDILEKTILPSLDNDKKYKRLKEILPNCSHYDVVPFNKLMQMVITYPKCEERRCRLTKQITPAIVVIRLLQVLDDLNHWSLREVVRWMI